MTLVEGTNLTNIHGRSFDVEMCDHRAVLIQQPTTRGRIQAGRLGGETWIVGSIVFLVFVETSLDAPVCVVV